jgi:small-conductance mechanosensitive channel
MLIKLQLLLFTAIFAGALEIVAFEKQYFINAAFFLIIFSVLVVWPLAKKVRFLAIPFFLSVGSLNLLYLINTFVERQVYIGLVSVVYYLALMGAYRLKFYECDRTAQGMVNMATIATVLVWYLSTYAWYLNYQIGSWLLACSFIVATFMISLPSLKICASLQMKRRKMAGFGGSEGTDNELCPRDSSAYPQPAYARELFARDIPTYMLINNWVIIFLNIILSFLMAEVIWALALWPFGYLTTGVAALIIFFVLWDTIRNFIQGSLTQSVVVADLLVAFFSITAVLLTARWELAV